MTGVLSYGWYFGICQNDIDPEGENRIQATCPTVTGSQNALLDWAWPCFPPGYSDVIDALLALSTMPSAPAYTAPTLVPAPGSAVWIGFVGGDTDYPVWCGTWKAR
jgi:hypothetical protein